MKTKLLAALCALLLPRAVTAGSTMDLWVYYSINLSVDEQVEKLGKIMQQASGEGYTKFLITDAKFATLAKQPPHYFENIGKVKAFAAQNKIEIVPALFPVGCSNALLANDPNLAEGLPVRDAPFIVKNGVAVLDAAPIVTGTWTTDKTLTPAEGGWRVDDIAGKEARFHQPIKVTPFRQYHVSVQIKTKGFDGDARIVPNLPNDNSLNYADLHVKPTQDWRTHDIYFNSLEYTEVNLYIGAWRGKSGTIAWRNPVIEETAFVNLVRRDGAPLEIRKNDGTKLVEGTDFEKHADPKMGVTPWPGAYDAWHEPPVLKTRLADGTRLKVSFYDVPTFGPKVMICISEPKTEELLRDQARRVHAAWNAKRYWMDHDEIHAVNWDKACQDRHMEPGEIIADNVKKCIGYIREVCPDAEIYVWGDMFDPNHNVKKDYYFANGDLTGSWKGLDKRVIVVPWSVDICEKSMKWFESLGNRMLLAGYYDEPPGKSAAWIKAAKKVPGVEGIMYTTWENRYSDMEPFSKVIRKAEAAPGQ